MRRFRRLLLVAIAILLISAGLLYRTYRSAQQSRAPALPAPLPPDTSAAAVGYHWSKTNQGRTEVELKAKSFQQLKNPNRLVLEDVEALIYDPRGERFDRFTTHQAEFGAEEGTLFADGDVEIQAGEPARPGVSPRRVLIQTSGLRYDSRTGRAWTDRPAKFRFENGEGESLGAAYEPEYREFLLRAQSRISWRGREGASEPMSVEAEEILYKERDQVIIASPRFRFKRGRLTVTGSRGVVWLREGDIDHIEAFSAQGAEQDGPDRNLEFAAEQIFIEFAAGGLISRVSAHQKARLVSQEKQAGHQVTAEHIELAFDRHGGTSELSRALASGQASVESRPPEDAKPATAALRTLRSEALELLMRPGGRQIQRIETRAPGVIELIPTQPGGRRRRLEGERLTLTYAGSNFLRTIEATAAATRTETPATPGKPAPPPMLTWSRRLRAEFAPQSNELEQLEQWENFRYEQGDRKGQAERAVFTSAGRTIVLSRNARFWDPTGSLAAQTITFDQQTGDLTAEGDVSSTRLPDAARPSSGLISGSEPLHARSARMALADGNRLVRYEGEVVLWQGANRIEADWVEIDRAGRTLKARGNVRSRFVEIPDPANKVAVPVYTLVSAGELDYTDQDRTALYRGQVTLVRRGVEIRADELRGRFSTGGQSAELEKAFADGRVTIVERSPARLRTGRGEHAEYTVTEGKVVLSGGEPQFEDTLRGRLQGRLLTWFMNEDRMMVDGDPAKPAVSIIRHK